MHKSAASQPFDKIPKQFIWNNESQHLFKKAITDVSKKFPMIETNFPSTSQGVQSCCDMFTTMMKEAANISLCLKKCFSRKTKKKWHDPEFYVLKRHFYSAEKRFRCQPNDHIARKCYFDLKKKY